MTNQTPAVLIERKRAEEALSSEAKWRSLVENAPDIIITVDREGTILFINHTVIGTSVKVSDVIGKTVFDFISPEHHDIAKKSIEEVFQTGKPASYDNTILEEYGGRWYTSWVGPVVRDGETVGATIIATDITERKEMEETLRKSQGQLEQRVAERTAELSVFQRFADGSVQALGMADMDSHITYANPILCRLLEESPQELLGKSFKTYYSQEHLEKLTEEIIPEVLTTGHWTGELPLRSNKGKPTSTIQSIFLIRDEKRNPIFFANVITDITEHKQEQQTLRQLLDSHDRDRQLIAYDIHDGLAQDLAAAKMQLQASEQLKGDDPEKASELYEAGVELLTKGIAETRQLISGLRPPILDKSGVVAAIERLVEDTRAEEEMEIELLSCLKSDRLAKMLENAIFRIVQESLTNVRKHSKSDKVRLEIVQEDDRIRIEIRDWGMGFDPDSIATGCFGLRGIQERAKLLGGLATIESKPGEGTRIAVELPLAEV